MSLNNSPLDPTHHPGTEGAKDAFPTVRDATVGATQQTAFPKPRINRQGGPNTLDGNGNLHDRRKPGCASEHGDVRLGRASQGRRDALTGRWVIFAPGRSERPAEILEAELPAPSHHSCPFCAGNESHTPPATYFIGESHDELATWTVRVVPNLFPAVSSNSPLHPLHVASGPHLRKLDGTPDLGWNPNTPLGGAMGLGDDPIYFSNASPEQFGGKENNRIDDRHTANADGLQENVGWQAFENPSEWSNEDLDSTAAYVSPTGNVNSSLFEYCDLHGGHEVIVETPHHVESITSLSPAHAAKVFSAYAERIRHWSKVAGVRYVVVFKNVGAAAGASIRHTHSQLIATSLLPPAMQEIGDRMRDHHQRVDRCLVCDMLKGELADGLRVVARTENFAAFCPFAGRLPYMVRIVPINHSDRFCAVSFQMLEELSRLTQQIVRALEAMFVSCAYNYTIHTRPPGMADRYAFHWWMEIFPRLTKVAGFEWGSDCYINPVTPEVAAEHLRDVLSKFFHATK